MAYADALFPWEVGRTGDYLGKNTPKGVFFYVIQAVIFERKFANFLLDLTACNYCCINENRKNSTK